MYPHISFRFQIVGDYKLHTFGANVNTIEALGTAKVQQLYWAFRMHDG